MQWWPQIFKSYNNEHCGSQFSNFKHENSRAFILVSVSGDFQLFLVILYFSWILLFATLLLTTLDYSWLFLATPGYTWLLLATLGYSWLFLATLDTWLLYSRILFAYKISTYLFLSIGYKSRALPKTVSFSNFLF